MEVENGNRNRSVTIGLGIWGPLMSIVIIASRAVCGNVPMEDWSCMSWFYMTLPVTIPFVVTLGALSLCGGTYLLCLFAKWISDLFRRRN